VASRWRKVCWHFLPYHRRAHFQFGDFTPTENVGSGLEATATSYKSIEEELTAHRAGLARVERRLAAIEAKLDMEPLH
jgi:hypothetical protein